jgi:hypothetical protein
MLAGFGAMAAFADRALARRVIDFLGSAEVWLVVAGILAVLLVVDLVLLTAADRRFRRGRLIARSP